MTPGRRLTISPKERQLLDALSRATRNNDMAEFNRLMDLPEDGYSPDPHPKPFPPLDEKDWDSTLWECLYDPKNYQHKPADPKEKPDA